MKRLMCGLLLAAFSAGCFAHITYTPDALNAMYAKGRLPKTGPVVMEKHSTMDFGECRAQANKQYAGYASRLPARIVVDSGVLYILKIWQVDGMKVVTCSRSEGSRFVTRAEYQ
ncbi:hypothetical protein [Martelella alba]|uniref:Lipoprotein n=1 Tax=Martelella alba TaxID=2590451 RepID=A0ABY2SNS2_9HYPH|nr:hypothetical protein [Martelella alba]TKI07647.1 hypothetical protein FCN80_04150 [Martelella alba]